MDIYVIKWMPRYSEGARRSCCSRICTSIAAFSGDVVFISDGSSYWLTELARTRESWRGKDCPTDFRCEVAHHPYVSSMV